MSSRTNARFEDLLVLAHDLADRSRAVIRPYFRKRLDVADKGGPKGFDPVTKADQAAERAITRLIRERAPDHGVIGEEYGAQRPDAAYQWVVDPIDGTRSFITGVPMWGTLIGLLHEGEPVLGVMDQPFTGERFWSGKRGSHLQEAGGRARRIRTRACPRVKDAVLMTTSPDLLEPGAETEAFLRVKKDARMTRFGGDCYAYCMLAAGFVDVVVEAGLKSYDIAALIPIVERAGGRMTTWDGRPATEGGRIVAVGDPALHEKVMKLLNR
ncbi:inositol monophosphatase [Hyphomicrobium nitrativorans NL23]|uniref:Histidinol-phosphatase n=1 Tax=Hyphomicrobium nitrativorans NL23 TaxID=1029756 RepID=V5SFZ7_9HYPH|nr:histidinol-phosphatase [Hyphomicrobium nitrativorans]AHB49463.1 inositol monophosphatase [Hyphomicrobium nitrativorans NL23]